MTRGIGAVEAVQSLLPEESIFVLGLLTQLGDVWFLLTIVAVAYWLSPTMADHDYRAVLVGLMLTTVGVLHAVKETLALPRPQLPIGQFDTLPPVVRALLELTATAGGYGFPSGHATAATVVYLGLASTLPTSTARRRFGVASGLIVLVAFTRIALGVHYLVDVVAGVLLGATLLTAGALLDEASPVDPPTTTFAASVAVAAIAAWIAGPDVTALALLGGTLGALAGWQGVVVAREEVNLAGFEPWRVVVAAVCAGLFLGVVGLGVRAGGAPIYTIGAGLAGFAAIAGPEAAGRLDIFRRRPVPE